MAAVRPTEWATNILKSKITFHWPECICECFSPLIKPPESRAWALWGQGHSFFLLEVPHGRQRQQTGQQQSSWACAFLTQRASVPLEMSPQPPGPEAPACPLQAKHCSLLVRIRPRSSVNFSHKQKLSCRKVAPEPAK